eukprot:UN02850
MNNIKEISGLPPNLVVLNLSDNRIKRIPKEMSSLKHLNVLRLANNKLHKVFKSHQNLVLSFASKVSK